MEIGIKKRGISFYKIKRYGFPRDFHAKSRRYCFTFY